MRSRAGGTKLWNVARASSWREKQTRLDEAWDTEAPTQSLVRRQTDNDALARSINALDSLAIAMALGGAVLTTGGVLTFVLSDRTSPEHATLTATPTGVWLSATW